MSSTKKKWLLFGVVFLSASFTLFAGNIYHTVKKGETLYGLSKKYHVTVKELMSVNNINSSATIKIGTKLIIPGQNNGTNTKNNSGNESGRSYVYYRIKKGDTFYSVSKKFGMSLKDLYALNNMTEKDILPIDFKLRVYKAGEAVVNGENSDSGKENKTDDKIGKKPVTTEPPKVVDKGNTPIKQVVILEPSPINITNPETVKTEEKVDVNLPSADEKEVRLPVAGSYKPMSGKLRGIEITVPGEDYFKALEDGTVIWKGPFRDFKNVILIDSGDYVYMFGGMNDIFVNVGQKVKKGDRIGGVGGTSDGKIYFSAFKDRMALEYKEVIGIINRRNI